MELKEIQSKLDAMCCVLGKEGYSFNGEEVRLLEETDPRIVGDKVQQILKAKLENDDDVDFYFFECTKQPFITKLDNTKAFKESNNVSAKITILRFIINRLTDSAKAKVPKDILIDRLTLSEEELASLFVNCHKDKVFVQAMLDSKYGNILIGQVKQEKYEDYAPLLMRAVFETNSSLFDSIIEDLLKEGTIRHLFNGISKSPKNLHIYLTECFKPETEVRSSFLNYLSEKSALDELSDMARVVIQKDTDLILAGPEFSDNPPKKDESEPTITAPIENGDEPQKPEPPKLTQAELLDEQVRAILGAPEKDLGLNAKQPEEIRSQIGKIGRNLPSNKLLASLKRVTNDFGNVDNFQTRYDSITKISIVESLLEHLKNEEERKDAIESIVMGKSLLSDEDLFKMYLGLDSENAMDPSHQVGIALLNTTFVEKIKNRLIHEKKVGNIEPLDRASEYKIAPIESWLEEWSKACNEAEKDNLFWNLSDTADDSEEELKLYYFLYYMNSGSQLAREYVEYIDKENILTTDLFNKLDTSQKQAVLTAASNDLARRLFSPLTIDAKATILSGAEDNLAARLKGLLNAAEQEEINNYGLYSDEIDFWTSILKGEKTTIADEINSKFSTEADENDLLNGFEQSIKEAATITEFNAFTDAKRDDIVRGIAASKISKENLIKIFNKFKAKGMVDINAITRLVGSLNYELSNSKKAVTALFSSDFADDLKTRLTNDILDSSKSKNVMDLLINFGKIRDIKDIPTDIVSSITNDAALFDNIIASFSKKNVHEFLNNNDHKKSQEYA